MKLPSSVFLTLLSVTCAVPNSGAQGLFKAPDSYPIPAVLLEAITSQQGIVEQQGVELKTDVPVSEVQLGSSGSGDLGRLSAATDRSDLDDLGDPSSAEGLLFLLASSFDKGVMGSGKVWLVLPSSPEASSVLIAGLGVNLGLCYDSEHEFLYVFDTTLEEKGRIFQYKAERKGKKMKIKKAEFTQIYEGEKVISCSVDEFSNLYFTHSSAINFVSYLDLWTGFRNQFEVLYSGNEDMVENVVDFKASGYLNLFWVNSDGEKDDNMVVKAPGRYRFGRPPDFMADSEGAISIATDDNYVYKGFSDGSITVVEKTTGESVLAATVTRPASMCASDSMLYIADTKDDVIFTFAVEDALAAKDAPAAENALAVPTALARLANISDLECVLAPSSAMVLVLTWLALW